MKHSCLTNTQEHKNEYSFIRQPVNWLTHFRMKFSSKMFFLYSLFSICHGQILYAQSSIDLTDHLLGVTDSIDIVHSEYSSRNDSSQLKILQDQLQESKLNEMNLRMEMEQFKLAGYAADSVKWTEQKARIDSLRNITAGIPVVIEGDTLFYIYANKGGLSPAGRAAQVENAILRLGKEYDLKPDSVFLLEEDTFTDIVYKGKVIVSVTDKDAMWMNTPREKLSGEYRLRVVSVLEVLKQKYSLVQLIKHILFLILVVFVQYILIRLTNHFYKKLKIKIDNIKQRFLKPVFIKNYEFLSIDKQKKLLFALLNVIRYIFIFIQLIFSILIVFSIFPQTEYLAMQLFSYILNPLKKIGINVANYIPNIFTILIIWLIIKYIIRGIKYLTNEIADERLKITGFYPDWAKPTYNITRFLLYAFMIVLIYPYLPNSQSKVFQGVSVFLGLIVSFGSSSAIGNLVAGMIITYMRSFRINDRIKINNIVGNVIEKTPIVTRILTIKNEIVTIPNSTIMNSQITNLSESARTRGLTLFLNITCGYDTPWRKVHQLLLDAADATPDVMKTPHPFVLEDGFDDFNVVYQINVFINDANKTTKISSDLRQNIQDKFKEAGISILSPHYYVNVPGKS
ncbi:MAG: mechanosensitive ion channel family protein [Dysgonamonadaceae bacterium]|jgi:small-conductance mechanosensitive channel|nr:mechanosensitive ion channel family protein [Dysgonamonadaceae bacterium]